MLGYLATGLICSVTSAWGISRCHRNPGMERPSVIDIWLGKEAGVKIPRARVKEIEDRTRNENPR